MSEDRLARIEAALAELATKADLEVAMATAVAGLATKADLDGVAKNVEIAALGRQLRELRDELRVTSAMVLRLDHMWPDVIEQLRAMVQQQLGILDRLRALEEPPA
jgi:glycine cleavage system regulatory protein